ncbi:hypothetical protein BDW02DRAFT_466875, partial [Decorospora gaudefroyi]
AIEDIESRESGASFSYSQIATRCGVDRRTLARPYQGQSQPGQLAQLSLHPQHDR